MARIAEHQTRNDRDLPGSAVDEFLAAGDVDGARAEFERLCLEGLEGEPVAMTPQAWEKFRDELHRKAKLAS
ncbi:MAG TPA: hypothetical protein VHU44_06960 [Acidobacteriaceae bacterium]|jgi:hypothetical protein|nr:hypothetical protein [Acidobacteriaceae bacterium]